MSIIDVTIGPRSDEQYEYLDASWPQQLMPLHSYRSGYQALCMRTFSPPSLFTSCIFQPPWETALSSVSSEQSLFCMSPCTISSPGWPCLTWACLLHSHDAKNMLVQFHGDFCWHVHCPGILQWIHRYGVFSAAHCVLRLLWHLLKYSSVLKSSTVVQTGLVFAVKSILLVLPLTLTLRRLRYCHMHLLSQSYSLHQDTMKLAYSDNRVSFYYGLFVAFCMMTVYSLLCPMCSSWRLCWVLHSMENG